MAEHTNTRTISDRFVLDYIRKSGNCTIQDLVDHAGVTATAIRQRLGRLMDQGLVTREAHAVGRGRPTHRYSLSPKGLRAAGDNYEDLAKVLWTELRSIKDPDVRVGLLSRVVQKFGEAYRNKVEGASLPERMASLQKLMAERDIPFELETSVDGDQLPVLKALACPYPDLAEQDRAICSLEKMLFTQVLGENVRLTACRLDGDNGCMFEPSPAGSNGAT